MQNWKINHQTNEIKKERSLKKKIKMKVVAILLISLSLALAVDIPVRGGKSYYEMDFILY